MGTKKLLATIVCTVMATSSMALAEEFIDTAIVLGTTPVVERLYAPSNRCKHSSYGKKSNEDPTMTLLGALVGGAAGSQVGSGSGQDAAAAIGALVGAKITTGEGEITGEELLGAVAGGVIGNQIGGGSGKTAATAAGAVLGSALATGKLSRDRGAIARECGDHVVSKRAITKYKVEYEYNGITLTGTLPYKPENTIDVIINVDVLEDRTI